ncbi:MAG: glucose 1-dehydrogenase [Parachlamydiaceae bacterium]
MNKKLEGKVAIVTGASKGIGAGIAKDLAKEGALVVVNYATSKEGADRVVQEIVKEGGKAIAVQADVSKKSDVEKLFKETYSQFKTLDILINNAGIYEFLPLEEITEAHFHRLFDINVLGLLLACKESLKYFGDKGGSIINISSIASTSGSPTSSVYSATKASVDIITKALAKELGPKKIRVNAINPGLVETEGVISKGFNDGDFKKEVERQSPLGRIGKPQDISPAAVFLASDDASWITGETLFISGGYR